MTPNHLLFVKLVALWLFVCLPISYAEYLGEKAIQRTQCKPIYAKCCAPVKVVFGRCTRTVVKKCQMEPEFIPLQ